ncbi:MAG: STAS/SEC14 domain-containing protein [Akkermansiaceae bacterium]|nr:STAS/SEC14 domain-containing protein [Akkermansiaceae bacterium]NNM30155.1 STAS/SEC14 domain-containing protein [Akkermansiaceae bacterium]
MITILPDLPKYVAGFRASGKVTAEDYESVLMPALDAAVAEGGPIRLLYILEASLTDFTLGAMWDDARTGWSHLQDFERVALVSDSPTVRGLLHAFHFMMPKSFAIFGLDEEAEAREWITAESAAPA